MKIRIVLVPDEHLSENAKSCSSLIAESVPSYFKLDREHLPHVTVASPEIEEKDLDQIVKLLEKAAAETSKIEVFVNEIKVDETTFIGLYFKDDKDVVRLRDKIIDFISEYNRGELVIKDSHLTLTRVQSEESVATAIKLAQQFPMGRYFLDSLAIGEDAENGTCKRILARFNLQ
jgi:2'-5' RNA ligase